MYDSSLSVNVKTTMKFKFKLNIIYGDLFQASNPSSSLAHCVSSDFKCGKGIATVFIQKFVRIKEFRGKNVPVGQVAVLKEGNRYIYNLVTKLKFNDEPTYQSMKHSLSKMKEHAIRFNVKEISMPKIGCGLDRLNWDVVESIIKDVFIETDITISVYVLGNKSDA